MGKAGGVIGHRRGRAPKGWWRISVMDMEILCRRLELTGYGRPPVGVRRFFGWTVRLETRWVSAIRAAIPYSEAQGSLMFPRPDPHIGGVRLKDRMASGTIRLKSDAPGGSGQPSRVWHYRNDRPFFDVARADVIPPYLGHRRVGGRFFRNHVQFHHAHVALSYFVLRLDLLVVQLAVMSLSFGGHYYIDNQYHVAESWLGRFSWFRRKQQLHFLHHRRGNCNFAVIDFFWDRLLGTYRSVEL